MILKLSRNTDVSKSITLKMFFCLDYDHYKIQIFSFFSMFLTIFLSYMQQALVILS